MWLKIKEGETIIATIDFTSIKSVAKHWTGARSELCLGEGCPHCLEGIPKRWRYQARLIVARENYQWEFGEQVMVELNKIPHDTNLASISLTRIGDARNTRYEISASEVKSEREAQPYDPKTAILASDFLRRQYGHIYEDQDEHG